MTEQLSAKALELIADRFRILSEPVRLRILHLLNEGELSVNAIAFELETSQPNASKHLKILQDAGMVGRRQDGNCVYYSIVDTSIFDLCELVCGSLEMRFRTNAAEFASV